MSKFVKVTNNCFGKKTVIINIDQIGTIERGNGNYVLRVLDNSNAGLYHISEADAKLIFDEIGVSL